MHQLGSHSQASPKFFCNIRIRMFFLFRANFSSFFVRLRFLIRSKICRNFELIPRTVKKNVGFEQVLQISLG